MKCLGKHETLHPNPVQGFDTDDGSAYYAMARNVVLYTPWGFKSDFGGHDNRCVKPSTLNPHPSPHHP